MTNGEPLPSKLVPPRKIIVGVAPGSPEVCATRKPDTAPDNACAGLV